MVDRLIGAICTRIGALYDGRIPIYTEKVHQGAVLPCFFIECEKAERVEMLNRRFLVRCVIKLTGENDGDGKLFEEESMTADIFASLGLVEADGHFFNGRKINAGWESGSFVVRATYDIWAESAEEEVDLMEVVTIKEIFDE